MPALEAAVNRPFNRTIVESGNRIVDTGGRVLRSQPGRHRRE
jgi:hypothetical protein